MLVNVPEFFSATIGGRQVTLAAATESVLLLRVSAEEELAEYHSYAVDKEFREAAAVARESPRRFRLGDLAVEVGTEPFVLRVSRGGRVLFETAPEALPPEPHAAVRLDRRREPDERIYGMGETGETFDKSGRSADLWNTDDWRRHPLQSFYAQIPYALHLAADGTVLHGLFLDNPGRQRHDLGFKDLEAACYEMQTGDLNAWIIFGETIGDIVRQWTGLTGRISRPPMWAIGNHQSRYSYYPESRVREIAAEFRKRRIPCDVLHFDIQYMDDFRVFTWDKNRFPDPGRLLADLREEGFRSVTIVDPGIKVDEEYEVYRAFTAEEGLVLAERNKPPYVGEVWPGKVHFPDFTNPKTRRLWGEFQKRALLDIGVAGIWNDMDEPANFPDQCVPGGLVHEDFGQRRTHEQVHQVYGHTMAQACCEGLRTARPNERPFAITRSGYAGTQRHAMIWTGDNESLWNNMPYDIQLNLSMGLTGITFVGCDIGGFGQQCTPELYARWIEWGVFQPFCRTHTSWKTRDQEPWAFGEEVESIARRMIELRMRLLPYLYTCFVEASENGTPINLPLFYDDPSDAATHHISDQFLLGRDLLVAPVVVRGMDRRMVYLPRGAWHHYWTGKQYAGGEWYIVEAPLGQPPLFVRAGAVIPMHPVRQHTGDGVVEEVSLDVWPGAGLSGHLVEDDGISEDWRRGVESRVSFAGEASADRLRLVIGAPQGPYRAPRKRWAVRLRVPAGRISSLQLDGETLPFQPDRGAVRAVFEDTRQRREIVAVLRPDPAS